MDRTFQVTSSSTSAINEDEAAFTRDEGWVLDGATSVSGRRRTSGGRAESDASWFVREFSDGLRRRPAELPVARWARAVLDELVGKAGAHWADWSSRDVPSASYAHVQVRDGAAQFFNLGDCRILYQADGGPVTLFGSCEVQRLDDALLRAYQHLRRSEPELDHARAWACLVPTIRAHRRLMNVPGGYWILSPDGLGLEHLQRVEVPFDRELRALLVTDGLYRLVDTYGQASVDGFFARAFERGGLPAMVDELRALEAADHTAARYARVKLQDDATALAVVARLGARGPS